MGVWFDRVGIIFQFLSFWFVAPEFIGEHRMRNLGRMLAQFFSASVFLILAVGMVAVVSSLAFLEGLHWFHRTGIALGLSLIVFLPGLFFYRLLRTRWLPILIDHLSDDERFRRGLLFVGGVLFILGAVLQFSATYF